MINIKKIFAGIMAFCIVGGVLPSADTAENHVAITANAEDLTAEQNSEENTTIMATEITTAISENGEEFEPNGTESSFDYEISDSLEIQSDEENVTEEETTETVPEVQEEEENITEEEAIETFSEVQEDFTYEVYYDYVVITGFNKDATTAVIPAEIEGLPVTIIGWGAFEGCSGLTSVTLPDSVTDIYSYAFSDCSGLKSITIPDGVTSINWGMFSGCSGLESITLPDSITSIANYAFRDCSSLESIVLPDSVTSIGEGAFSGCSSLTSITIPDSLTNIESDAFKDTPWFEEKQKENPLIIINNILFDGKACSGDVVIPDGVTSIFNGAFEKCSSLTSITLPDSVTSIGNKAFKGCSKLKSITIPDSVTSIESHAFSDCLNLTNITIPDGVTKIPYRAFYCCSGLESITIPDSVTYIDRDAFNGCLSLESITIPDSVKGIDDGVFEECSSLTSITIPDSVTIIGSDAFKYCSGLESITIPDGVTHIGIGAFFGCSSLKSIIIPDGVTSIPFGAFAGCSGLESIIIPDSVTKIENDAFSGCSSLTSITLPDNLTSVSIDAFKNTPWLEEKQKENPLVIIGNVLIDGKDCSGDVVIPDGVTKINSEVFKGCSDITSITIPDSITDIGNNAFEGCSGLTNITIPDSVTKIYEYTFSGCSSLESITIPDGVTSIGRYAFEGCSSLESITIPDSVTSIGRYAFSDCSCLINITIPDSVKSIDDYTFSGCSSLASITISDSITYIGSYAFRECSSLESITIPDSVTNIYDGTFMKCSKLTSITIENPFCEISDSSTTISNGYEKGKYYFNGEIHGYSDSNIQKYAEDYGYKFVSLGEKFITQGDFTYEMHVNYVRITECNKNLTEAVIPDEFDGRTVKEICDDVFSDCKELTSITVPESVEYIGSGFGDGCTALKEINVDEKNTVYYSYDGVLYKYLEVRKYNSDMPTYETETYKTLLVCPQGKQGEYTVKEGTERINDSAFEGCTGIMAVNLPESVVTIANRAFAGCTGLKSLDIPAGVTLIGNGFNNGCTALEEINVDEKNTVYYSHEGVLYKNAESFKYNYDTGSYESVKYKVVLVCPEGKKGSYTVQGGTERINDSAFEGCAGITAINIPESVTYIGYYFSRNCPVLEEINVDKKNTVYYSHEGVLYKNAESLTYNYDTHSYESVKYKAVLVCPEGKKGNYTIKDGTELIGGLAFENCAYLESVSVPESVKEIERSYFGLKSTISNGNEEKIDEYDSAYYDYYFNGTIYGYENSTAQKYAEDCGYKFVVISPSENKPGDVNGDNMVDSVDASLILLEYVLLSTEGNGNLTGSQKSVADINDDGMLDSVDASLVLQYYVYASTDGTESPEEFFGKV